MLTQNLIQDTSTTNRVGNFSDLSFLRAFQMELTHRLRKGSVEQGASGIGRSASSDPSISEQNAMSAAQLLIAEPKKAIAFTRPKGSQRVIPFIQHFMHAMQTFKDKRVLFIDAHVSSRGFTSMTRQNEFGLGWLDLISGSAPVWRVIQRLESSNIFFVERGRKSKNPLQDYYAENIRHFFDLLFSLFDYLIIDTPALDNLKGYDALIKTCDAMALVTEDSFPDAPCRKQIESQINQFGIEFWGTYVSAPIMNSTMDGMK